MAREPAVSAHAGRTRLRIEQGHFAEYGALPEGDKAVRANVVLHGAVDTRRAFGDDEEFVAGLALAKDVIARV